MNIILSTHPADAREASQHGFPLCHMAYRIGKEFRLYRSGLGISVKGGLLSLGDYGFDEAAAYAPDLMRDLVRECTVRGFDGVVCDFEREEHPALRQFVYEAGEYLKRHGYTLTVPRAYADAAETAHVLISSAVTGGSFQEKLQSAFAKVGPDRAVLMIEPVATDLLMPSPDGEGETLSRTALEALIEKEGALPYMSQELCACYFTYRDSAGGSHFVLFDDARSIVKKLAAAKDMGFREATVLYPEVRDVLDKLHELRKVPVN
ncbi:hypothetical protein LJC32_01940 [Oscillospiraceae bacterium OttesenSCG-928-F05]|nr:hypothetical protein [Oscillospiraceae bacterium OttesenSCG-928-F05]